MNISPFSRLIKPVFDLATMSVPMLSPKEQQRIVRYARQNLSEILLIPKGIEGTLSY